MEPCIGRALPPREDWGTFSAHSPSVLSFHRPWPVAAVVCKGVGFLRMGRQDMVRYLSLKSGLQDVLEHFPLQQVGLPGGPEFPVGTTVEI